MSSEAPLNEDGASTPENRLPQDPQTSRQTQKPSRVCRFYNTKKGCRAGSQCPFRHVEPKAETATPKQKHEQHPEAVDASSSASGQNPPQRSKQNANKPVTVQKPVSQLQQRDPREFQISQLLKRFSPTRQELDDCTILSLAMPPSDPDFPYNLSELQCKLTIPKSYPGGDRPSLRVTNDHLPRGFQINVENGFRSLTSHSPQKTLLALMNDLDKNLEKFLAFEETLTIKMIANAERRARKPVTTVPAHPPPASEPVPMVAPTPVWTSQQKADAQAKRQSDIRQLEARMGRVPHFSKNPDATLYNIPVQISKPGKLSVNLQSLKEVSLSVPKLYNLEPCTIRLNGVNGPEIETVHLAFEKYSREHPEMTLMAHINYLTQNIHTMASQPLEKAQPIPVGPSLLEQHFQDEREKAILADPGESSIDACRKIVDPDRPHLRMIPRPPEWDPEAESDSDKASDTSYDSDEYTESDSDEEDEVEEVEDGGGAALPVSSAPVDKGIHLSFPGLELYNIELLTIASLSISVKCLRCKTPLDIHNVKASNLAQSTTVTTRTETCLKCTTPFTISFIPSPLHANTIRAGTIDVAGCTIGDLLPSMFQPTCSSCSSTFAAPPGMVSVRGDKPIQVCRSCHAKMSFTIPEVKFLRVSSHSATLPLRKPKKENLGISAGTALPEKGTCPHYRHSYRWFRFGCCNRVYPCDRCHDAAESHVNEHADRMVCGWCSREQRFRAEDCAICGHGLMRRRRAAGGFWEGGQGTRDKRLMSRKEKRKYKRPQGSAVGKKSEATK
ncbi:uncharacterized protein PV06_03783 [Exophiala oligosperma]|uniref:CHY-type domain-containing protein n=1 Tax=Exophiala oligosperma TaxID=215243 RepID=A0A0D2AZY1_9EURO|nr:uncharacterized protein PV06_03783 [Exophiala oligosperma]KIW45386.1 hypothetical protein PV06_03783 [Exophiala oligosperma]